MGKRGPERSNRDIEHAVHDVFQLTSFAGEGVVNRAAKMGVIVPDRGPGRYSLGRAVEIVIFNKEHQGKH